MNNETAMKSGKCCRRMWHIKIKPRCAQKCANLQQQGSIKVFGQD